MVIIKNENVVLRNIHSTCLLINSKEKYWESKSLVKINDIGKLIWELLDKSNNTNEILKNIIEIYNINPIDFESVKKDINTFLDGLQKVGYVIYG